MRFHSKPTSNPKMLPVIPRRPQITSNDPKVLILIDLSVRIRHSMCPLSDCIEPATTVTFEGQIIKLFMKEFLKLKNFLIPNKNPYHMGHMTYSLQPHMIQSGPYGQSGYSKRESQGRAYFSLFVHYSVKCQNLNF